MALISPTLGLKNVPLVMIPANMSRVMVLDVAAKMDTPIVRALVFYQDVIAPSASVTMMVVVATNTITGRIQEIKDITIPIKMKGFVMDVSYVLPGKRLVMSDVIK